MATNQDYVKVPVFRPSAEDFCDFSEYVEKVVYPKAVDVGLAKIIPPTSWKPNPKHSYDELLRNIQVKAPISQAVLRKRECELGVYSILTQERENMSVKMFSEQAVSASQQILKSRKVEYEDASWTPPETLTLSERHMLQIKHLSTEYVERSFWKNIHFEPPVYGADMEGTLFDPSVTNWNLNTLNTILDLIPTKILGVNSTCLYFGMWKAMFGWHTEDMDLYSINYLHVGAQKHWYAVSHKQRVLFEHFMKDRFQDEFKACDQFLRHKSVMVNPKLLQEHGIHVASTVQKEGEFIITLPAAYHSGFNRGFNCAESINFALRNYLEFGKVASYCSCPSSSGDSVCFDVMKLVEDIEDMELMGASTAASPGSDELNDDSESESMSSSLSSSEFSYDTDFISSDLDIELGIADRPVVDRSWWTPLSDFLLRTCWHKERRTPNGLDKTAQYLSQPIAQVGLRLVILNEFSRERFLNMFPVYRDIDLNKLVSEGEAGKSTSTSDNQSPEDCRRCHALAKCIVLLEQEVEAKKDELMVLTHELEVMKTNGTASCQQKDVVGFLANLSRAVCQLSNRVQSVDGGMSDYPELFNSELNQLYEYFDTSPPDRLLVPDQAPPVSIELPLKPIALRPQVARTESEGFRPPKRRRTTGIFRQTTAVADRKRGQVPTSLDSQVKDLLAYYDKCYADAKVLGVRLSPKRTFDLDHL